MRGSRGKLSDMSRKMTCSFGSSRMMKVFVVLSTLYCLCFAEKEFLNKGNLWDNESSIEQSESGQGWTGAGDSVFVCALSSGAKLPFKHINVADARRVYVEIDYKLTKKNGKTSSGFFLLFNSMVSDDNSETKNGDSVFVKRFVSNIVSVNTSKATLHYDLNEDDHFMNLTFYAVGACVQVFKIRMYYYVCPTNKKLMVTRTAAPSKGFIEASANCSIKQSGKKGSVVVAKCGSDGEWRKVEDKEGGCTNDCGAGTELINDTCTECKENYFKKDRGTHGCVPCPENSVSEKGSPRCKCKERHYLENGLCKAIPSRPMNLRYIQLSSNTIKLHWNISQNDTVVHPGLHFHVTCMEYDKNNGNWGHCRNLSLGERGTNVTRSFLEVEPLLNNTNYTFSVAAFNNVSVHLRKWNKATINVYVAWNAVENHNPTEVGKTSIEPVTTRKVKDDISAIPNTPEVTRKGTPPTVRLSTSLSSSYGQEGKKSVQKSSNSQIAPYIGIAIGAILFILVVIVIVIFRRRRRTKKKTLINNEEGFSMNTTPQTYVDPNKYGNPEKAVKKFAKEIDRREIKLEGLIGEGEFAKVHKGMLCRPNEPPVPVALKILKPGSTAKNREDFLTEAAVMGQFRDLNIVALEGVVTISRPVMIITEFMHNGALSDYLVQNKNRFSEIELLVMARGIASGMKYLAKMRFVHRDLAARNVLVNENLVCKVADFGLTRELEESCQGEYVTQGGKIPIRWTAPEAYKHRRFTTASDVWSFGIVLWEIMSYAERPYGDWDNYMVMDQVTANYRLFAPTNCPKIVHQLMMECWKADRSQRPSFSDIVEMLDRWIRNPYLLKDYQYVTEKDRMADRKSCVAKSIRDYLEAIKMDRYIDNFIDFGYTELYQIQNMTDGDLVGIGVPLVGHRNKIIKSLRGERELLLPVDV